MLYRTEIKQQDRIIFSKTLLGAQPGQVLRKSLELLHSVITIAQAYILNEIGELWQYSIQKLGGRIQVQLLHHSRRQFSSSELILLLSGNKSISGVLGL